MISILESIIQPICRTAVRVSVALVSYGGLQLCGLSFTGNSPKTILKVIMSLLGRMYGRSVVLREPKLRWQFRRRWHAAELCSPRLPRKPSKGFPVMVSGMIRCRWSSAARLDSKAAVRWLGLAFPSCLFKSLLLSFRALISSLSSFT